MNSVATITIVGRVGSAPEVRSTPDGTPITNVRVAVSEYRKGAGEFNSITRWYEVTLRGKSAESASENLEPGDVIAATGKLTIDEYTDREGRDRFQLKVNAAGFDTIARKQASSAAAK